MTIGCSRRLASTMPVDGGLHAGAKYLNTRTEAFRFSMPPPLRESWNDGVENILDGLCALMAATGGCMALRLGDVVAASGCANGRDARIDGAANARGTWHDFWRRTWRAAYFHLLTAGCRLSVDWVCGNRFGRRGEAGAWSCGAARCGLSLRSRAEVTNPFG